MTSENKRPGFNKVPIALPKADGPSHGNSSLITQEAGLQAAIGSRIRVTTMQPNQSNIEGTVYTADSITNLLILNTASAAQTNDISPQAFTAPPGTYQFIPISQISSFQILNLAQSPTSTESSKPATTNLPTNLDIQALNTRLQRSVAAAQAALARQGPQGTTAVQQALFDGLSRMYPTRWEGSSMIISDSFILEKPYDPRNLKLLPGAHGDAERVRRVVEREKTNANLRQPINLKVGNGAAKVPTAETPRKGG